MAKTTALIIARGGSRRVPGKNLLHLGGKSLLGHKIARLRAAQRIDEVVVGSDCSEIRAEALSHGGKAVIRPDYFCDETRTTSNEMIANMCSLVQTDLVVWAHCTNPFVKSSTFDRAIECYHDKRREGYDSLLSVAEMRGHLWDNARRPSNFDPYATHHVQAGQIEPIYFQDGAIFIQPHAQMVKNAYYFGDNPYLFVMPEDEVWDIDSWHDFHIAKAYIEARGVRTET